MNHRLLASHGLKYNPFTPDLPVEALLPMPASEDFLWRIENAHVPAGGFALITGEPGSGKSVTLRRLVARLAPLPELTVACLTRPSAGLADFYRELGDLFGVELAPHNRWRGFKALRETWKQHLEHSRLRPVLIIDEAQEMNSPVLSELRLLASADFDAKALLSVVFAGDERFTALLRQPDLRPLGSRIRTRLTLQSATRDELKTLLVHLLEHAGNPHLIVPALHDTLADHALGNPRVLMNLAAELLATAVHQNRSQIDETLFFELFPATPKRRRA